MFDYSDFNHKIQLSKSIDYSKFKFTNSIDYSKFKLFKSNPIIIPISSTMNCTKNENGVNDCEITECYLRVCFR
jgi:hypothetical protein